MTRFTPHKRGQRVSTPYKFPHNAPAPHQHTMPLAYRPECRPMKRRKARALLATAALVCASCTTGPDGKQTFDWRTAGTVTTGVINVLQASQQAPAPQALPVTATK